MSPGFLDERRLLKGPGPAFERDVARLLVANGFHQVRLLGERGAVLLAIKNNETWLVRCEFVGGSFSSATVVEEAANAARLHKADRVYVASSRPAGPATIAAIERWRALGLEVGLLEPAALLAMMAATPEYCKSRRLLREYQDAAVERFVSALRETGRGHVQLATGLGKTVVMAETVAELFRESALPQSRVLVCAGTRELVDQLQWAFWGQLPKWVATHRLMAGEEPAFWEGVTFATTQSVVSRLDTLPDFDLVLIDEAHHIGSETLQRVVSQMAAAMIGGVTATPWRGDEYNIDTVLGHPVMQMGIAEGMKGGYLCKTDYRLMADDIDWEWVRSKSQKSYSISQLNRLLLVPTRDEEAARAIRATFDQEKRRAVIVFCATVMHAEVFAGMLRLFGLRTETISGSMSDQDRDKVMSALKAGQLDAVTARDLFNEGVDVPDVDMIAFMRVTHSRRIFVQQLGRGLRVSPGKDKVVILDFVSDLRRIAEVLSMESAMNAGVERLDHFASVRFRDQMLSTCMTKWVMEQADLLSREDDPELELPKLDSIFQEQR